VNDIVSKLRNLIASPNFFERILPLFEIRLNQFLFSRKPTTQNIRSFDGFINSVSVVNAELSSYLKPNSEAEKAFQKVQANIGEINDKNRLPFPIYYNADISLGVLCYALTRSLKPNIVIETGVGYGITSSLILLALEKNNCGKLRSIDLHPLSDVEGRFIGIAIPEHLRHRWRLERGSSRRLLKEVISREKEINVFVHDSANIYTLQKWEFSTVWGKLTPGGAAVFNNISEKFLKYIKSVPDAQVFTHWQVEKPSCVTGLIVKRSESGGR
jgi:hypothetical protein